MKEVGREELTERKLEIGERFNIKSHNIKIYVGREPVGSDLGRHVDTMKRCGSTIGYVAWRLSDIDSGQTQDRGRRLGVLKSVDCDYTTIVAVKPRTGRVVVADSSS